MSELGTPKKQRFEFHMQVVMICDTSQQAFTVYAKTLKTLEALYNGAPYEVAMSASQILTPVLEPSRLVLVEGGASGKDS